MRARRPDRQDFVERNGITVGFEVYDGGQPALLFVPAAPQRVVGTRLSRQMQPA